MAELQFGYSRALQASGAQLTGAGLTVVQDAAGGFNVVDKPNASSAPVVTQPVAPRTGAPLPSTLPPGIRTPAPAPSGGGGFMPSAQEKAAMDAKVLADPGAEPVHNLVSTGTIPLDMLGAPTATSTMPLYGEQLMGKAPNAPEDDFQKEQMRVWRDFEKENNAYLQNEIQAQNIIEATNALMNKMGPGDTLPPDQAGTVINQLYQIAKSRDPKTGVRMPEIGLDEEFMSKLQHFYTLWKGISETPVTRVKLESLKNAAIQISKADAAVIKRTQMRKKKGIESIYNRPATGLGGAWDLNESAPATASGTYDPRKVW